MDIKVWKIINDERVRSGGSEVDESICLDEYDVSDNMARLCDEIYSNAGASPRAA